VERLTPVCRASSICVALGWARTASSTLFHTSGGSRGRPRSLAMESLAIFDAVNAIDGTPGYLVHLEAPVDAAPDAAVAAAGHRVLSYLYPAQQAAFNALFAASLETIPDGQGKIDGVAVLTDWLSMTPADGLGSRPVASRACSSSAVAVITPGSRLREYALAAHPVTDVAAQKVRNRSSTGSPQTQQVWRDPLFCFLSCPDSDSSAAITSGLCCRISSIRSVGR
jgi:hypothetical protein